MLQHDITNKKYFEDGVEISKEEYAVKWEEWKKHPPEPEPPGPDLENVEPDEAFDIIFGGAE